MEEVKTRASLLIGRVGIWIMGKCMVAVGAMSSSFGDGGDTRGHAGGGRCSRCW